MAFSDWLVWMNEWMGAYHSTENSGVNFRKFPWASMGEWYRIFRLTAPEWKTISPFHSQFCPKKLKMGDSPEFLFAFEIFSDSEFIIDELMVDDDDIIALSAIGRCYMRRNLNRIYNFSHGNYRAVLFAGWIQEPFSYDKRNVWAIRTGSHEDGKDTQEDLPFHRRSKYWPSCGAWGIKSLHGLSPTGSTLPVLTEF